MMYSKKKFKLREGAMVDDLIKKFEENSPIVKSLNSTLLILKKLVIVGIFYFLIICFIQQYEFIALTFILIISLSTALYLIKKSAEILYLNSKHLGRNNAGKYN